MRKQASNSFYAYLRRDLLLSYRRLGEAASPLIFFVMASTLVPLGMTPDLASLAKIAPGIIWVLALLATMLSVGGLFAGDYQDGS
ncbi:MAG: heme exporter protein CcmB, partial [Porticoccaceae bacterium]|nr:heme exporter protein CcmB [Porticoccaceae bacterium]